MNAKGVLHGAGAFQGRFHSSAELLITAEKRPAPSASFWVASPQTG
jgi:hypothetical protein